MANLRNSQLPLLGDGGFQHDDSGADPGKGKLGGEMGTKPTP